jgi:hypothetical protein
MFFAELAVLHMLKQSLPEPVDFSHVLPPKRLVIDGSQDVFPRIVNGHHDDLLSHQYCVYISYPSMAGHEKENVRDRAIGCMARCNTPAEGIRKASLRET